MPVAVGQRESEDVFMQRAYENVSRQGKAAERTPLVTFDTKSSRAQLSALQGTQLVQAKKPMPAVTRRRKKAAARGRRRGSSKVRIIGGRVRLRVAGFPGVQALSPSHLVRHIAAAKLRLAAKKVLGQLRKNARGKQESGGKREGRRRGARLQSKRPEAESKLPTWTIRDLTLPLFPHGGSTASRLCTDLSTQKWKIIITLDSSFRMNFSFPSTARCPPCLTA